MEVLNINQGKQELSELEESKEFKNFEKYEFFNFDEKGNKLKWGDYDLSNNDDQEIILRDNQIFNECLLKMNEKNGFNMQPLPELYPHFTISVNSDKITELLIRGMNVEKNKDLRTVWQDSHYLSIKSKVNDNIRGSYRRNLNGTFNITMQEHNMFNLNMLDDSLRDNYYLSIKIKTEITTYDVEIIYTRKGVRDGRWRTWFLNTGKKAKCFHVGIHPQIKVNGVNCTRLVIDNFVNQ